MIYSSRVICRTNFANAKLISMCFLEDLAFLYSVELAMSNRVRIGLLELMSRMRFLVRRDNEAVCYISFTCSYKILNATFHLTSSRNREKWDLPFVADRIPGLEI